MKKLEEFLERGGIKKEITLLVISAIALIFSLVKPVKFPIDPAWVAILLCGIPIILEAVIGLVTRFDIKADVLVSLALIASVFIGENFAAGEVAVIMQLGALLEDLTVAKARAGIEKLVHLTPRNARVVEGKTEKIVSADEVRVGDILRVLPGEIIPVDGVILDGQTSINQAVMTGESIPVDKSAGDEVASGTMNQYGSFEMRATKVGEDSSIQRMIRLVQSADAGKAKIVGVADRWATWIVVIALSAAFLTLLLTGEVIRAVTVLVVFCPCALVLATPTAIMAAIGNATGHGFLVREGDALERLSYVKKITFDKTGTLTYGEPQVVDVRSFRREILAEELFAYVEAVESKSEHPLGKAMVRDYHRRELEHEYVTEEFQMIPGRGVSGIVEGRQILAGNRQMLEEAHIPLEEKLLDSAKNYLEQGCTLVYIAIDHVCAGLVVLSDTLRESAAEMIGELKQGGVSPVLLTGDHENAANHMASRLQISEVHANCLPEDKMAYIQECEKNNLPVCMIGDGINDAPALKRAYVGIAMGAIGSDIAVDAADIVLVNDEVNELPHLLSLSRKMMRTIKWNLAFSMGLNFLAIVLAITGVLNPVVGALVHNAGSVFVILNSALLLKYKEEAVVEKITVNQEKVGNLYSL